jgi:hypothetical protein
MTQEFPQSYIILDALDECTNRAELMDILESMARWRLEGLHILITSRKERDIESSLEDFVDKRNTICLQSKLVDKDIYTYIHQRLSDDKNLSKWQKHDDIRQEIETTLMKGAQGMYISPLVGLESLMLIRITGLDGLCASWIHWESVAMGQSYGNPWQRYHQRWMRHTSGSFALLIGTTPTMPSVFYGGWHFQRGRF